MIQRIKNLFGFGDLENALFIILINVLVILGVHLLITWGILGILGETQDRITALEQHTGYAIDKDAP